MWLFEENLLVVLGMLLLVLCGVLCVEWFCVVVLGCE